MRLRLQCNRLVFRPQSDKESNRFTTTCQAPSLRGHHRPFRIMTRARPNLPVLLAFGSALLWGAWWMPVRWLESVGLHGVWAATAMLGAAVPVLLAAQLGIPRSRRAQDGLDTRTIASGALIGVAMTLYTAAIADTTVVRAVLLFYLAPVWSILIEVTWLGRRLRWLNGVAFGLAALGVLTIFRFDLGGSSWSLGDTMALLSGMCWAAGSALVFTGRDIGALRLSLFGCLGAVAASLVCAALLGQAIPSNADAARAVGPALVTGTIYIAPVLVATLWSARRLSPTTLSFLLTGEILSGIGTAAWLLNEPFGWQELLGAGLVILAALIEVTLPKPVAA